MLVFLNQMNYKKIKTSMKLRKFILALIALCICVHVNAQLGSTSDIPVVTEFSIPVSPAFDLLGVNNALVARPGNIRDFKVDWAFKSWRLKPNLALQAQPVWELLYNKAKLEKYRKASSLMRTLSTLDISAGTIEDQSLARRLSFAVKMTLYKGKDALLDAGLFNDAEAEYTAKRTELETSIDLLKLELKKASSKEEKQEIKDQIEAKESQIDFLDVKQKGENLAIASTFAKRNWNASFLDIAYGKVYTYSNDTLSKLDLKGSGYAFWLNGSYGIGKKILLSGVLRLTVIDNAIIGENSSLVSGGINFRYGSPKFNFFAELMYTQTDQKFGFADEQQNIIAASTLSTSYGGDWRLSRNVTLTYGVRVDYNRLLKFQTIVPVAGIACMMR